MSVYFLTLYMHIYILPLLMLELYPGRNKGTACFSLKTARFSFTILISLLQMEQCFSIYDVLFLATIKFGRQEIRFLRRIQQKSHKMELAI